MSDNEEKKKNPKASIEAPESTRPQSFLVIRESDESGISGTGLIAEGCVFSNGMCAVQWLDANPCMQVWPAPGGFASFRKIHLDMHPENNTKIVWNKWPKEEAETNESQEA